MTKQTIAQVIELAHTLRAEGYIAGYRGEGCYGCRLLDAVGDFLADAQRETKKRVIHGDEAKQEISSG